MKADPDRCDNGPRLGVGDNDCPWNLFTDFRPQVSGLGVLPRTALTRLLPSDQRNPRLCPTATGRMNFDVIEKPSFSFVWN